MADKKISELTELTTPDGTEELVVNDSGVSKKITQTNLLSTALPLAGGTMTGNITLGTNTIDGLEINVSATSNLGLGTGAVDSITTGDYNVGVGDSALTATTTGYQNTASGHRSLYSNTTGYYNTASGSYALYSNTASYNTAIGRSALETNTTGANNTASGYAALLSNTTGVNNTANGSGALRLNTTGANNTASGYAALYSNTTGTQNTAVGKDALYSNTTGNYNNAFGTGALSSTTTGAHNIGLGRNSQSTSATANSQCTLGDDQINNLRCNDQSISALSDSRDKTDVIDSPYGLDFINTVRPVQFLWDTRYGNCKDGTTRIGFIAQELLAATDGNNAVLDLVLDDNPDKLEAKYGNLLPIAIKAIQELSAKNDALEARIVALEPTA